MTQGTDPKNTGTKSTGPKNVDKKNVETLYPLSATQQGILFHSLAAPGAGMYVGQLRFRLEGPLDVAALRRAWDAVVARHGALRTAFRWQDLREPVQIVAKQVELPFTLHDWRDLDTATQERRLTELLRDDLEQGFDLTVAPLVRLTLIRRADKAHELLWTRHHLIVDGWSVALVFQEVLRHYVAEGQGASLAIEPAPRYRDYIVWQRRQDAAEAETAWRRELAGLTALTPFDFGSAEDPASEDPSSEGEMRWADVATEIPWDTTAALAELGRREGLTLYTWVQAAWAILLGRLQNRDDVLFGTVVSGRPADLRGVQGMVGLFINTQPLRADLPLDRPVLDWAQDLQQHQAALRVHEHVALHQIQGWSDLPRGQAMFDTLLVYENYPVDPMASEGTSGASTDTAGIHIEPILGRERTNYPLTLTVRQGRTLPITVTFDRTRTASADIERLLGHLGRLLAGIAANPDTPIAELPWLAESDRQQLLTTWSGPVRPLADHDTLDGLVRAQAERTPDAIAFEQDGVQLNYAQLVAQSEGFASTLAEAGVGQGDLVGLGLERTLALPVALLAVLRLGAAYVPLDPAYPQARLALMLDDAQPRALVAEPGSDLADLAAADCPVLAPSEDTYEAPTLPPRRPLAQALAYVIYTSGSTGRPKGVQIPHGTVVNFLAAMARRPGLGADDVLVAVTSLSFDISVLELYLPLAVGGRVVLATRQQAADGQALRRLVEHWDRATREAGRGGAAMLQATPATWRLLDASGFRAHPPFRQLSGGEALSRELAQRLVAHGAPVWNLYGPTETTIWSSVAEVESGLGAITLGQAIDNTQLHAVDRHARLLPAGVPGELWIGGDGLAQGYLDRPALTAERFVPDPWSERPGSRLYRTGDLVRRRGEGPEAGAFDYLGRIDFQVKVRGHRIELGEVEAVLERLAAVAQAVAVVRLDASGEGRLVAYVVPEPGAQPTVDQLRREAGESLPAVMVPAVIVLLDVFPLTPNGKVDRKALPEPGGARPDLATTLVRPRGEVETTIADIWAKLLEIDTVGLDDNFFDLGGHSILAIRVHEEVVRAFEVDLTLVELFEHPTVGALARRVEALTRETDGTTNTTPPPMRRRARRSTDTDPGIAVVGLAGRFPGAPSVAALWRQLLDGVEGVRDFTDAEIADASKHTGVPADDPEATLIRRRGILDDIDRFDAPFFGINPREAELLDPQHRLFLEVAAQALDDAGHPDEREGHAIGVYAGASMSSYLLHHVVPHLQQRGFDAAWQMVLGNDKDHLATRVAYLLGLTGPAVLVQTACSTSLVAVHMARRALLAGECDLALAGGAAVRVPQTLPLRYQPGGINAPDGHCRPFDAQAQGTVGGNGVAAVVLRRLDDALADGDTIHAVIRGSAINNDGHHKVGYTAPSVEGQAQVVRTALDEAGFDPATLGFVEAHGTGTTLGDPIEVRALHRAWDAAQLDPDTCALGSLKGNLGHLDTASGIAGLIKAVLAVEHGVVPPTLHLDTPSPRIPWNEGPFFVPNKTTPWPKPDGPRRAAVSSFGLGGTNAHVVLEQAPRSTEDPATTVTEVSAGPLTLALSPGGRGDQKVSNQSTTQATATTPTEVFGVGGESERKRSVPLHRTSEGHQPTEVRHTPTEPPTAEGVGERTEPTPDTGPSSPSTAISANLIISATAGPLTLALSPGGRGNQKGDRKGPFTLVLSAKTPTALAKTAEHLADHLEENPGLNLEDVAFTLAVGRRAHSHRRALRVADTPDAIATLRGNNPTAVRESVVDGRPAWTAFLFPGQGTAWAGMGRELYERPGVFRQTLDHCDALLREPLGESLLEALYGPAASDEALAQTRLAQPAVFAVSHALAELWTSWGLEPDLLLGHSVGEYVAAHRAGVFDLETALTLLARRGALMQSLPTGSMLSLPVSAQRFDELLATHGHDLDGTLDLAADNGPEAIVVSGPDTAIEPFAQRLAQAGIESRRLRTSHAFHSAMMDPILDAFADEVTRHQLAPPNARVLSNASGQPLTAEQATSPDYWVQHLRGTVRFGPGLATLFAETGNGLVLEVGPGRSLSALTRRALQASETTTTTRIVASLARGRGATPDDAVDRLDQARTDVWLAGAPIAPIETQPPRRRVSLPPTAFDSHRFWLDPVATAAPVEPGLHVHWPSWRQRPIAPSTPQGTQGTTTSRAILCPDKASAEGLLKHLPEATVVALGQGPYDLESLRQKLVDTPPTRLWLGPGWVDSEHQGWHRDGLPTLVEALQALAEPDADLVVLTQGHEEVLGNEPLGAEGATVQAVVAWAAHRGLTVQTVDGAPSTSDATDWFEALPPRTALRGAFRWIPEPVVEVPSTTPTDTTPAGARDSVLAADTVLGVVGNSEPSLAALLADACSLELRSLTEAPQPASKSNGALVLVDQVQPAKTAATPTTLADQLATTRDLAEATLERLENLAETTGSTAVLLHYDLALQRAGDPVASALVEYLADQVRRLDRTSIRRWRLLGWTLDLDQLDAARDRARLAQAVDRLLAEGGVCTAVAGPADLDTWLAPRPDEPATNDAPGFRPHTSTPYAPPEGPTETLLASLWEELLGVSPVGRFDDFFELGGHSLLGTQMMARVTAELGRELPLRSLFDTPVLEALAQVLEGALEGTDLDPSAHPVVVEPIPTIDRDGPLPLSFAQQRLWFLDQLEPGSPVYNLPFALRLDGTVRPGVLAAAFGQLVARHEVLRTRFTSERGEPRQHVREVTARDVTAQTSSAWPLPLVDLNGLDPERRQPEARRLAQIEGRTPFDLAQGDLLRTRLLRLTEREHVLTVTVHHIVADGWSLGVLVRELGALYQALAEGSQPYLPSLPIQYADFAAWQRDWLEGEVLERQLDHWRQRLGDASTALDLPTDRPRPAVLDARGDAVRFALEPGLVEQAKAVSRQRGATLFMTLLAAFDTLLYRVTGQRDLVVGSPVANRTRVETEGLIGFFVNTLVLRNTVAPDQGLDRLIDGVKETSLDAQAHQDVPFELLVQELQPERDLSRSPLFQVLFILQNTPIEPLDLPDLELSPLGVDTGAATFDLTLSLSERPTGLEGVLGFRRDLFDRQTVERLSEQYERLLRAALDDPETPLQWLPLLSETELHQIRHELAPGPAADPVTETLADRLEQQAQQTPDAVAIVDVRGTTTYGALRRRAHQIAGALRHQGVTVETPVGVALERTADLVATLWGVMAAGGAYVPLDPQHPTSRLQGVIADARLALLVSDRGSLLALGAAVDDFAGPQLDLASLGEPPSSPEGSLPGPLSPDALAYVLFTSGSTGRPKGVAIRHGALLGFLDAMAERPGFEANDTLAAITTLSFDISMLELFLPLIRGGRLALIDAETASDPHALARRLDAVGATVMQATPAGWHQLLEAGWTNPKGLRVFCGGEALPRPLADRLATLAGDRVWNLYGPTEATVWISVAEVHAGDGFRVEAPEAQDDSPRWPVDLGRPLPGARLEVLDRQLQPVPLGVAGELYLAGPALARGYWGLPARTAAAFVPDPLGSGERLYRTGDLVRRDAEGRLIFLGRVDHQVKVRGFRIELGEIEAALLRHPAVRQAVVVARTDGDTQLVGYVVPGTKTANGETPIPANAAEWRSFLADHLPAYMVPSTVMTLDAFPTNTSGKIDRKALPAPERGRSAAAPFVAPRDPVEEAVAEIWREVLALDRLGIHDGFFDLGGHSLLATQVTSRVFETFQIELPLRQLFADPTVAGLAEAVRQAQSESLDASDEELLRRIEAMSDDDLDEELAKLLASEVESP